MHTENASLSWLLGGAVPPFLTTPGVDLDDSANMLADFLAEENWHVAFVDAAGDCMFVLHRPAAGWCRGSRAGRRLGMLQRSCT